MWHLLFGRSCSVHFSQSLFQVLCDLIRAAGVAETALDALKALNDLLAKLGIAADEAGYMGDDIVDLKILDACGFSAAPADCHEMVKSYVDMVSTKIGGRGAVREVCEFILDAQGKLDEALAPYLPVRAK